MPQLQSYEQKSYKLFCWAQDNNVSRDSYDELISLFNKWIIQDDFGKKPLLSPKTSENRLGKLFQLDETVYRICLKRCHLFPQGSYDECSCGEQQFKSNGKPVETMSYFPLGRQLSNLIADKETCEMIQDVHEPEPRQMNDIFDVLVAIIPGDHNGDLFSFLTPLLNELCILEDGGLKVICEDGLFNFKVHLLLASGDIIGVQELIHHKGHNSDYGCRQCHIKTVREIGPAGKGYGRYYTGTNNMSTARKDDEFKNGDKDFGIVKKNEFATLKSFHGYSFFGLDELHLIGSNVTKRLWDMILGQYGDLDTTIKLRSSACSAIGKVITESNATIPSGIFEGSFRDVSRKAGHMRSVDWIMLLQCIVPTLVFEQLAETYGAYSEQVEALMSLVIGCTLALQWKIYANDVSAIQKHLQIWHMHMKNKISSNLYTVNFHYLRHIHDIIQKLSPLRGYSTRSAERAIGMLLQVHIRFTTAMIKRVYLMDELETVLEDGDAYSLDEYPDIELWDWKVMQLEDFDHLNIERYIRQYWHNQFDDDRALGATLELEIKVGKDLFKDSTRFICNEYSSVAKKSDTIIKMRLPIRGGGEATFFGELILFFTHRFRDAQPPVTPGSIQERFEGISQSDEEMAVIESTETMEGVEEEGILDERPLCLVKLFGNLKMTDYGTKERKKKGLPYGP
ncbi:hypothetical protein INT45_001813 [Circinella minor]|uniref:Uncharacterized protein n=1 Tax=Circinella minor TaxID=1195481 RepID=A0A8H7VF18_9FUNG|nr:hypothetical protein INT45_001813 [Circinella minor]